MTTEKKIKTNIEFVTELMTFSYHGELTQVFVIEALRRYADIISSQPKPEGDTEGVVSAIAWHEIAEETKARLETNYGNTPA